MTDAKQMLEKIADKYADKDDPLLVKMTRSMLIAELTAAQSSAVSALVRPLEWSEGKGELEGQLVWSSGDPWVFWIVKNPNDKYIWCENFNIEGFCPCSPVRGTYDTLGEAQAAAQADYENRVLAALAAPQPADSAPAPPPEYGGVVNVSYYDARGTKAADRAPATKSAPVSSATHNSGEGDPSVTPDYAGADTAWCQPMENGKHTPRKFLLYFDDPDHGNAVFDNEAEARAVFEKANVAWNCYLFGSLPHQAALDALAALSSEPAPAVQMIVADGASKSPFRFRRYVDGVEMADSVEITQASNVQEAFAKARSLYGRPRGMDLVLENSPPAVAQGARKDGDQ